MLSKIEYLIIENTNFENLRLSRQNSCLLYRSLIDDMLAAMLDTETVNHECLRNPLSLIAEGFIELQSLPFSEK